MKEIAILVFHCHVVINCSTVIVYALKKHHVIGNSCSSEPETSPYEWFDQLLDHFTPTDLTLWKQRYAVNATFYKEGGPVFLRVGEEDAIDIESEYSWQWMVLGRQFHALCFMLENRFYGKSHPTADTGIENLKYLTTEQILADIAYFIEGMNQKHKLHQDVKWILFGTSYSASLATWARVRFPYLIHGAVASSALLLAVLDFTGFMETIKNSIAAYSETCVTEIMTATQQLEVYLQDEDGRKYIVEHFRLCDSLDEYTDNDISNLYCAIPTLIVTIVQYNKDNVESLNSRNLSIDVICDMMNPDGKTQAIDRYAAMTTFLLDKFDENCLDYKYTNEVDSLNKTDWDDTSGDSRQWIYQTCTEFGWFQTSSKETDIFGPHFDVNFFIQQCIDFYGTGFNETLITNAIERTNIFTGAKAINPTNMIFVQHDRDPWYTVGMFPPDEDKNYHVFLVEGTAHCADMQPSSPNDNPQLVDVRKKIFSILASWLNADC